MIVSYIAANVQVQDHHDHVAISGRESMRVLAYVRLVPPEVQEVAREDEPDWM